MGMVRSPQRATGTSSGFAMLLRTSFVQIHEIKDDLTGTSPMLTMGVDLIPAIATVCLLQHVPNMHREIVLVVFTNSVQMRYIRPLDPIVMLTSILALTLIVRAYLSSSTIKLTCTPYRKQPWAMACLRYLHEPLLSRSLCLPST